MSSEVWVMGEMIVEIMRTKVDADFDQPEVFQGPYPSGAPAICIDTVARLGHSAAIIGGVGNDGFGRCLLTRMERDGVDTSQVCVSDTGATGCAFVTYFSDGSRKYIFHMNNTPVTEVKAPPADVFEGAKFFHIMGCSLTIQEAFGQEIVAAMERAISKGAKVSFDPNIRMELLKGDTSLKLVREVLANSSVFFPGREELMLITGEQDEIAAVAKCFENPKLELLALKKGSEGSTVYTRSEMLDMGVYSTNVVDATGAGDSFDGAFLCGLLEGKPLEEVLKMASAAGSLNTAAFGPMEGAISPETLYATITQ